MKIQSGLVRGQVLQRLGSDGATATVRGETGQTGYVLVTLQGRHGVVRGWKSRPVGKARAGKFHALVAGIPTGGPYRLTFICGRERVVVADIFVGDVWLLAGQSNMKGVGNMGGTAKPHPLVRMFSMRREWRLATEPLHVWMESPDVCHNGGQQCAPEEGERLRRVAVKGTGVGIFFAREMLEKSGVPQGLICTAQGGTSMQQWSPTKKSAGASASLYASLLASVAATGQPVAGVLWYQGEGDANAADAARYTERMQELVRCTRRDLRQPRLPWVVVQLARVFRRTESAAAWNSVQDQQRLLPTRIRHLETVAAVDLPMDDPIHVGAAGFPRLGRRLAAALRGLSEKSRAPRCRPPQLHTIRSRSSLCPNEWLVEVRFRHVGGALVSAGEPQGFVTVDAAGNAVPVLYRTTLLGDTACLHLCEDPGRTNLRIGYGLGLSPVCTIGDERDFSLPVFGPHRLEVTHAWLPFLTSWLTTGILPARKPLRLLTARDLARVPYGHRTPESAADGFVNEHARWQGHSGQAFFAASLLLPEPMVLRCLMGYDGPFALWVGGRRIFLDEKGCNPARCDAIGKSVKLSAGRHELHVAMDLNGGAAWGFFLRFCRRDVAKKHLRAEDYLRPEYLLPEA